MRACRIPLTESLAGHSLCGYKESRHDWTTELNWTEINIISKGYHQLACYFSGIFSFSLPYKSKWELFSMLHWKETQSGDLHWLSPTREQIKIKWIHSIDLGFPGGSAVKKKKICLQYRRCSFDPWIGKILWRRKWQPTPVFLPGKSHGQRSLGGYSPWGCKKVRHDSATTTTLIYPNS